jgi:N-methylhydantoinase A
MTYMLGIDTGGTFTDLVLYNQISKEITIMKVPSTPHNPAEGILNGINKITQLLCVEPKNLQFLIHGTTVATNAVLENKGAKTALLVTEGFKDILGIVRQDRPMMYDMFAQRPQALIPRHLRYEVKERVLYNGDVLIPLDSKQAEEIAIKLKEESIEAIAICLLHSYVNPAHEIKLKQVLSSRLPGIKISISSEILPEFREYERMSTTILNSYVHPVMEDYLMQLAENLQTIGFKKELHVMQSNGGIMTKKTAAEKCVHTIVSGPAAGVVAGVYLAKVSGSNNVITVDMGGTSFDICLAYNGEIKLTKETDIGGHTIKVPMIDINTIGAGGGSIAWIDPGGALRVGPESAGAKPGPACYCLGGTEPTVTDANLVLGRINPEYYLGGEMWVDKEKSYTAIKNRIADPLNLTVEEAAEGIIKVINATMVKGIRFVSVERGYDPREFAMVSFGGGGPLHTSDLSKELGIKKVIVPLVPGVTSAWGLLLSDFRHDFSQTFFRNTEDIDLADLNMQYLSLEGQGLEKISEGKVSKDQVILLRKAELRYAGQGYELEVDVPLGKLTRECIQLMEISFHKRHEEIYGYKITDGKTAFVNIGVTVIGKLPRPDIEFYQETGEDSTHAKKAIRNVYIDGKYIETIIYDRYALKTGNIIYGPAIIEQVDTTTLIKPGEVCTLDKICNLVITISSEEGNAE